MDLTTFKGINIPDAITFYNTVKANIQNFESPKEHSVIHNTTNLISNKSVMLQCVSKYPVHPNRPKNYHKDVFNLIFTFSKKSVDISCIVEHSKLKFGQQVSDLTYVFDQDFQLFTAKLELGPNNRKNPIDPQTYINLINVLYSEIDVINSNYSYLLRSNGKLIKDPSGNTTDKVMSLKRGRYLLVPKNGEFRIYEKCNFPSVDNRLLAVFHNQSDALKYFQTLKKESLGRFLLKGCYDKHVLTHKFGKRLKTYLSLYFPYKIRSIYTENIGKVKINIDHPNISHVIISGDRPLFVTYHRKPNCDGKFFIENNVTQYDENYHVAYNVFPPIK